MLGPAPVTMKAIWQLVKETASSWNNINAPRLGAALAFYTMLSIAPLLVLSIAVAGLIFGEQAAQGRVVAELQSLIGFQGGLVIQDLLAHARHLSSGIEALVVGVVLLFYGASSVFAELRDSLNLVWGFGTVSGPGVMGVVRSRFVAFGMVVGIGFLLLVSLLFSAASAAAGKFFGAILPIPEIVLHAANALFSFCAVTVLFALLYKVIPELKIEWRDVWIGAAVTSALFSLVMACRWSFRIPSWSKPGSICWIFQPSFSMSPDTRCIPCVRQAAGRGASDKGVQ